MQAQDNLSNLNNNNNSKRNSNVLQPMTQMVKAKVMRPSLMITERYKSNQKTKKSKASIPNINLGMISPTPL